MVLRRKNRVTYFYPRPPRGGRRSRRHWRGCRNPISIHALREEGDADIQRDRPEGCEHFYPRPPRGGRRLGSPCDS